VDVAVVREDEVYFYTKNWMLDSGYLILGGQPPRGTDRFPVIEIRSDAIQEKGSRASFKPDLVVATPNELLVIECKPVFDEQDVIKLDSISRSGVRLKALVDHLRQRRSLERNGHPLAIRSDDYLVEHTKFCIAYSGTHRPIQGLYSLVFKPDGSTATLFRGDLPSSAF
jgi:hypothetical protein